MQWHLETEARAPTRLWPPGLDAVRHPRRARRSGSLPRASARRPGWESRLGGARGGIGDEGPRW